MWGKHQRVLILNYNFHRRCRLYAFTDDNGKTKPGMVRPLSHTECAAVYLELWDVPIENFGKFIQQVSLLLVGSVARSLVTNC